MSQQTAPARPVEMQREHPDGAVAPLSESRVRSAPLRWAGPRLRLNRLGTVREGTAVAVFDQDQPPQLKRAGELLLPGFAPWRPPVEVMVINLSPVALDVRVDRLLTLDGVYLDVIGLTVEVELVESAVPELLTEHGDGLELWLEEEVQWSVEGSVRAAVGMNRAADLRRQALSQLLQGRWLPDVLAHGALRRTGLTVGVVQWAGDDGSPAPYPRVAGADHAAPRDGTAPAPGRPTTSADEATARPATDRRSPAVPDADGRTVTRLDADGRPTGLMDDGPPTVVQVAATPAAAPPATAPSGAGGPGDDVGWGRRGSGAATLTDLPAVDVSRLRFGNLSPGRLFRASGSVQDALRLVHVPALISVPVFWVFFVVYWVPEFTSFPGAHFALEQLSPLASKELSSRSEPLVGSQVGRLGLPAAYLLLVSLVLPALARSRWWLGRLALWPLTYLAVVAALVTLIGIVARGRVGAELVGAVLLVVWAVAAVVTVWRSLWVDVDLLPRRPTQVLWLLLVFALLTPVPIAVGRALFAPELRLAAQSVLGNDLTLRWAALLTPSTALVYLCGVACGAVVWAVYMLLPPVRRARLWAPVATLVLACVSVFALAPVTTESAAQRAAVIAERSPAAELSLTCGSWTQQPAAGPVVTLVVNGLGCKKVTAFSGYREIATRPTGISVAPVTARTLSDRRIPGKLAGAQFSDVVVLVATSRADHRAQSLVALRVADGAELWRFSCSGDNLLKVRFAGSSGGEEPEAGRSTLPGERPGVVADCGGGLVRLDPRSGALT